MCTNLVFKLPLPGLGELGLDNVCDRLGDPLFFQKVKLAFGRMHVDINRYGVELYAKGASFVFLKTTGKRNLPEVYKRRSAFWKNAGVTSRTLPDLQQVGEGRHFSLHNPCDIPAILTVGLKRCLTSRVLLFFFFY